MESTTLSLLTKHGILNLTFRPMLTDTQSQQFHDYIAHSRATSKQELCDDLARMAHEWGVTLEVDGIVI